MSTGPFPAPEAARLGSFKHGDRVTLPEALELVNLPEFPESWAIVPDPDGEALRLMWGDACDLLELSRSAKWNADTLADLKASNTPSGEA